jgi:O-antigen ligase
MLVAGALITAIAYPIFVDLRLGQTFGSAGQAGQGAQAESDNLRATQAVAAVKAFLEAPFLGHGFGTFGALSPKYSGQDVLTSAHNAYLKLAAEQGVVGLGLFVAFLAAIAWALWRAPVGPWIAGLAVLGVISIFSLTGDSMSNAQAIASGFVVIGAMLVAADAGLDPLGSDETNYDQLTPEGD